MQDFLNSKGFKIALTTIGVFLIALIVFAAGVSVGLHKARFSFRFGENYERNFVDPHTGTENPKGPMGMMREGLRQFEGQDFRNPHGLAGTIISISGNNIVVKDGDGKENTVVTNDKTILKQGRDDIKISDLKNDEKIVVVGAPGDNGVINANLIRIFNANLNNPTENNQ